MANWLDNNETVTKNGKPKIDKQVQECIYVKTIPISFFGTIRVQNNTDKLEHIQNLENREFKKFRKNGNKTNCKEKKRARDVANKVVIWH